LLESENERLKSHIMTLTEQNQGVNFIKNFILIFSFCLLLI